MSENDRANQAGPDKGEQMDRVMALLEAYIADPNRAPDRIHRLMKRVFTEGDPLSSDDEDMLSLVVDDFFKGVDIRKSYPAFFEQMADNPNLLVAFLDTVEVLSQSSAESPASAALPESDLAFLQHDPPRAAIQDDGDSWRAAWQITAATLNRIFSQPQGALARSEDLLEDPWFILLRTDFQVQDLTLFLNLEAAYSLDQPDFLQLQLTVFPRTREPLPPPGLDVVITWNTYQETVLLNTTLPTMLPGVPLADVVDTNTGRFLSDIQLQLQPAA